MRQIFKNNTAPGTSRYRSVWCFNSRPRYVCKDKEGSLSRHAHLTSEKTKEPQEGNRSSSSYCALEKKYAHTNTSGYIYAKKNNQTKTVVLRSRKVDTGKTKYLPSFSKEWKNLIYAYNKNNLKNIPVNDVNINKIIKSYFNLYFKDPDTLLQPKLFKKTPPHILQVALAWGANKSCSSRMISPSAWLASNKNIVNKGKLNSVTSSLRKRRKFLRRIYVSNAEIKHNNNKVIISLFTVNREKKNLKKKYLKINRKIGKKLIKRYFLLYTKYKIKIWNNLILKKPVDVCTNTEASAEGSVREGSNIQVSIEKDPFTGGALANGTKIRWKIKFLKYKLENLNRIIKLKNLCIKKIWGLIIRKSWKSYFKLLRKYDLMYSLNKYKFNKKILLPILSNILNKIIGKKKIRYNIINIKSLAYNADIFTDALALKISKKKMNLSKSMSNLLDKAKLSSPRAEIRMNPRLATIDLFLDKYKDLKIISSLGGRFASGSPQHFVQKRSDISLRSAANIAAPAYSSRGALALPVGKAKQYLSGAIKNTGRYVRSRSLDKLLSDAFNKKNIHKTVYNSVGYKNLGGIRLEVKGRLTKRYRADRSVYSEKVKGGLKNQDSSLKGFSSVLFRGNSPSNISSSLFKSKRRVGAFAVKGWISGR